MARPRRTIIDVSETPVVHCISRCIRRAFLCGVDEYSGESYEHRREWVQTRLLELTEAFSIEVCAYSVMSNHLHVVLYVDEVKAKNWSVFEVLTQWHKVFAGTLLTQKFTHGIELNEFELINISETTEVYRQRLLDISWFMRALNEPIARQANKEDNCTGRFWEGRFKSQPLLDEAAILACMVYVDLNPIRAKMATTPEASDFTSIQLRIRAAIKGEQPSKLMKFIGNEHQDSPIGLHFGLQDYLQLVEETGRIIRDDKRGAISATSASILNRLNISQDNWLKITSEFSTLFKGPVGSLPQLSRYCENQGFKRRQGASNCQKWLSSA